MNEMRCLWWEKDLDRLRKDQNPSWYGPRPRLRLPLEPPPREPIPPPREPGEEDSEVIIKIKL